MRHLHLQTLIAATPADCFELSLSVDAHTSSMGDSQERAVAGITTGIMRLGDTVTWQARHFRHSFRMTSVITAYERPHRFVDEQSSGPFRRWWHEHTFQPANSGGTLMTDRVEFYSPLGALGAVVDQLVLERYLYKLLRQRNMWLKRSLETSR